MADIEHEIYDGLLVMDHFDDCIIGVVKGLETKKKFVTVIGK